ANASTDARLARSSSASSTSARGAACSTACNAACPFCRLRQAITTWAPRCASSRAVLRPRPLLAPVTIAVRPLWSGICSLLQVLPMFPPKGSYDVRASLAREACGCSHKLAAQPVGSGADSERRLEVGMATVGRDVESVELTTQELWADGPPL